MYFGIDIGGTKIQFAVGSKDGKVVILNKVSTPKRYQELLELVVVNFREAERIHGRGAITHAGIGIPGTFTKEKVIWVPNIPCLEGEDLAADLRVRLKADVFMGNDAQLALVGEVWKGVGQGRKDAVLMSIGTGIGGAIMVGGKLIKGRRGAAGAFGWLNLDTSIPGDKNHGYLENFASGLAIEKIGREMDPVLTSFEIVRRARLGDELCIKVMEKVGHLIGVSLASIASVLDTEILILSGGLSEVLDVFEDSMNRSFLEYSAPGVLEVPCVQSVLGNLSGVYGAVRLAMVMDDLWI
jgi:predicted NBD/HSP70 family sugar kinase